MAIPIIYDWERFFNDYDEGLGSSYERIVLNTLLSRIVAQYKIKNVLEAPSFGFTGVSGINSMNLVKEGLDLTIMDSRGGRLSMIEELWRKETALISSKPDDDAENVNFIYSADFSELPFNDDSFDMSWNFSAIWFVKDLQLFLEELARVTSKVILITVPNKTGLGFIWQDILAHWKYRNKGEGEHYHKRYINKQLFVPALQRLGWKLLEHGFIDSPPWPDIGMKKEDFLKLFGLKILLDNDHAGGSAKTSFIAAGKSEKHLHHSKPNAIINYYAGKDPAFPQRMMKHFWFEKYLPSFVKMFWAHHHYYLFVPESNTD